MLRQSRFIVADAAPADVNERPTAPASSLPAPSRPRDLSELGRRVLVEAQRQAREALAAERATAPASVVPRSAQSDQPPARRPEGRARMQSIDAGN